MDSESKSEPARPEDPLPDPPPRARENAARCPFCGATDAKVISLFGSQVMTMQCHCRACGNYFEASKY